MSIVPKFELYLVQHIIVNHTHNVKLMFFIFLMAALILFSIWSIEPFENQCLKAGYGMNIVR